MKLVTIEISATIIIFFMISAVSFLLLQSKIDFFHLENIAYQKKLADFKKKGTAEKSDLAIKKSLSQWQHQHPNFYRAISENANPNQMTVSLTQAILQSGFLILQNASTHFVLTGKYSDLLYLLNAMNQLPWPISITQISIQNGTQFTLTFSIGKMHD